MHESVFTELAIIIAIGAGISMIMRLIRQPFIIGYILTGLIVGPSVLNIIQSAETIEVFASFGIALLLFIIGLGLNPKIVKEVGKVSLYAAGAQILFTTIISFMLATAFGFTKIESIIIGLALSFSSTIIVLTLLNNKKEQTRLNGKISIGILLIEDIIATFALIFVNAQSDGQFSASTLLILAVKGIALVVPLFFFSYKILPFFNKLIAGSQELLFLFAIGWGFGIAAIFQYFGFSIEVGALFAGVALASQPYAQEVASRLRPLRDFFIVVFFISLGAGLSVGEFGGIWVYVLVFSLLVIWLKPIIFMGVLGIMGYTKNTSFKVGGALSQISEFSLVLVILASQQGIIRDEIVTLITIVALITIAISAYAVTYSNQLYFLLERHLSFFVRNNPKKERFHINKYDIVIFGYNRGGREFIRVAQHMRKKFVVVDYDPVVVETLEKRHLHYIYGDATDPELLEELNLTHAKMIVSTATDHQTNMLIAKFIDQINPAAVFICTADTAHQAAELYATNVSYVMMPHYIGSEKIGSFIKRKGYDKAEFAKYREKHLKHLETHYT